MPMWCNADGFGLSAVKAFLRYCIIIHWFVLNGFTLVWVFSLMLSMVGVAYRLTGKSGQFWLLVWSDLRVIYFGVGDVLCWRYGELRLGPLVCGVPGLLPWWGWLL